LTRIVSIAWIDSLACSASLAPENRGVALGQFVPTHFVPPRIASCDEGACMAFQGTVPLWLITFAGPTSVGFRTHGGAQISLDPSRGAGKSTELRNTVINFVFPYGHNHGEPEDANSSCFCYRHRDGGFGRALAASERRAALQRKLCWTALQQRMRPQRPRPDRRQRWPP